MEILGGNKVREKVIDVDVKLKITINGKEVAEVKQILNDIIGLIDEFNNEVEKIGD